MPVSLLDSHEIVVLPVSGRIFVEQRFRPLAGRCETAKKELTADIRGGRGKVSVETACDEEKGLFTTRTAVQKPGHYTIRLGRQRRLLGVSVAKVSLLYNQADFDSGEDASYAKAVALDAGQTATGEVHYHTGDRTDWYRMVGSRTTVALELKGVEGSAVEAEVFAPLPGGMGVRPLGTLPLGHPKRFSLGKDDVLVRIRARERSGRTRYELTRQDSEGTKSARVEVIDCYPTGGGMGLALLRVSDGVAIGDSILISASDASGRRRTLGKCSVTSLEAGQASCSLPYSAHADWVDFRAEGVFAPREGSA